MSTSCPVGAKNTVGSLWDVPAAWREKSAASVTEKLSIVVTFCRKNVPGSPGGVAPILQLRSGHALNGARGWAAHRADICLKIAVLFLKIPRHSLSLSEM